jgi:hypothetical protein
MQAARARCVDAVVTANAAISRAERRADEAAAQTSVDRAYNEAVKQAVERRQQIHDFAAASPEQGPWDLARHFGVSITTSRVALRGSGA